MHDTQLSVLVGAGFPELPLAEQLPLVRWLGATGVQIYFNDSAPPAARAVRREVEAAGLALRSMHAPFGPGYDISSPDGEERRAALSRLTASLDVLRELGGTYAVVHPAAEARRMGRRERRRRCLTVADSLARLVPEAASRGLALALENMPPGWLGGAIDDLIGIVEMVASPTLGVCFDVGHAHWAGRLVRMWRKAAPACSTMHVHDNDGREDLHRVPFAGTVDWEAFGRALDETRYAGDVVIECLEALVGAYRRGDSAWRDRFRRWWSRGRP